jgi:hypothetical protein
VTPTGNFGRVITKEDVLNFLSGKTYTVASKDVAPKQACSASTRN